MKLVIKKIFAREFLILITLGIMSGLIFLSVYPYNSYHKNIVDNISATILSKTILADSLSFSFISKTKNQVWLHSKLLEEYDISINPEYTKEKMWEKLSSISQKDSIKIRWVTKWNDNWRIFFTKIGFDNPQKLKSYLDDNSLNAKDYSNKEIASKVQVEIESLNKQKVFHVKKILTYSEQMNLFQKAIIFFAIFLFAIRYLYYGIRWSFQTLKQ